MLLLLRQQEATPSSERRLIKATVTQVRQMTRKAPPGCKFLYIEGGNVLLKVNTEDVLTKEVRRALGALLGAELGLTGVFEYDNQYGAQWLCMWPYED